ncbi:family 16 glycosylhydrolase [Beijerinckia sp. L45]|uniref:family 16 glycosylhydrolase n=1 Tax=Beijerinckia sp. L45 TaxID=1641855 RepID=UPI00131D2C64|nr:family 16 glycosylhydrolase [Beijerinckia sp. L45]
MTGTAFGANPIPVSRLHALRDARALRWLGHRGSYVVGVPLLSVLGFATTLYIPRLISPAEFGAYALLLNIYRYAGRGDLGLSQLADRRLAFGADGQDAGRILKARFRLGLLTLALIVLLGVIGLAMSGRAAVLDTTLAAAAGTCAMMAAGPSSIYRARGQVWEYTVLSFVFSIGFMVPRLVGVELAGVTGCFAALLCWYAVTAVVSALRFAPLLASSTVPGQFRNTLRAALPLFVFAAVWTLYLSANRWVSAALSTPNDLGLFSLGANMSMAAITTFASIGDVRYPHWLNRLARAEPGSESGALEREGMLMALVLAIAVALCIPLAGRVVTVAFPAYGGAAPAAVALAIATVPLAIVAWFLPIAIAATASPLRDSAVVFLPATLVLIVGMTAGNALGSIEGQAWGCFCSSLAALSGLALCLRRMKILHTGAAVRFVVVPSALLVPVVGLAMIIGPHDGTAMAAGQEAPAQGPPAGWRIAFADDFTTLNMWDGIHGIWEPRYPWGGRTNPTANELEYYVDPRPQHETAPLRVLNPFSVDARGLTITARPIPDQDRASVKTLTYASGLLNSLHGFSFTYGYVEMRASVPRGQGLWPAFWLLPVKRIWPPEIDVMEVIGSEDRQFWATLHKGTAPAVVQFRIETDELYDTMHTYAVLWDADAIAWYFDGRRVASTPTPADFHQPMYLLVNLAVGGSWAGAPDITTHFPARMTIASIRVYQPATGLADTWRTDRDQDR